MAILRLILLVAVLGGLTLLLVQNWSPIIPLVFLGMRSQPLPLAIWILFSTTAGALTTVFITSLINLSNYLTQQERQASPRSTATSRRRNESRFEEPTPPSNPPRSDGETESRTSDTSDEWEKNSKIYDDWEFDEKQDNFATSNPQDKRSDRRSEPQDSSKTDSAYSYNYREPKNSGVGKTESIYDADYRVIVPPYQPPTTQEAEEDDWGFLDENDLKDEDKRPRP